MSSRQLLVHVVDRIAGWSGILRRFQRSAAEGITVLMYHRVLPDDQCRSYPDQKLVMPQSAFEMQMNWLARHCRVLPLRDALAADAKRAHGPLSVCVTFDDGYYDNATVAAPAMEAAGLRGTFFVTTQFISGAMLWFDKAALHWIMTPREALQLAADGARQANAALPEPTSFENWMTLLKVCPPAQRLAILKSLDQTNTLRYDAALFAPMSLEQMRGLEERGHEVGSHTVTHPILPQLDDQALREELTESRRCLEKWLGHPPAGFCYPNGSHDDRVVEAVQQAGYAHACTTRRGFYRAGGDALRIPRRAMFPASVTGARMRPSAAAFRAELVGYHDWMRERRKRGIPAPSRTEL